MRDFTNSTDEDDGAGDRNFSFGEKIDGLQHSELVLVSNKLSWPNDVNLERSRLRDE